MTDETDTSAPERIWAAPSPHRGWGEGYARRWQAPAKPKDTKYVRADLYDALRHRAERAEARAGSLRDAALEVAAFRAQVTQGGLDHTSLMRALERLEAALRQDEGGA